MRQAYDYWQDQPGISVLQQLRPATGASVSSTEPTTTRLHRPGTRASERRSARGRADAEDGRTTATAGVPAYDRPRFVWIRGVQTGACASRRARRDETRVDGRQMSGPTSRTADRSRPIYNGPQPRSWGKPGRDAKSVVPGLRPGDRRARRRWPAATGMFWRREPVDCETVTGVVIGVSIRFARWRPTGRRACNAG